ncbi:MAG: dTMP kinase [Myxococcales bacterium]|nr:dTMP kinase [Myxococcales bacterium]MCB9707923.1 dTMP kinase [Myxococcales bacterium]
MIEGSFIVLEGVDGAGTTTHVRLLAKEFRARGLPVFRTGEPSRGPVGGLLRQILTGRVVVHGLQGARPPSWGTMALLFAADRMDHLEAEIIPNLMDGVNVVSDRYDHSSVAYQSLSAGSKPAIIDWVRELNARAKRPDLTIVLDVPAEVAQARRRSRMMAQEMYEDDALQRELVEFYANIDEYFPKDTICHVNANRPISEVAAEIYERVRIFRGDTVA